MPIKEYKCENCGVTSEITTISAKYDQDVVNCALCGGECRIKPSVPSLAGAATWKPDHAVPIRVSADESHHTLNAYKGAIDPEMPGGMSSHVVSPKDI